MYSPACGQNIYGDWTKDSFPREQSWLYTKIDSQLEKLFQVNFQLVAINFCQSHLLVHQCKIKCKQRDMARNRLALTAENVEPQIEINFMKMKLGTNYSHCLFFLLPRVHCVSLCGLVKGLFPERLLVILKCQWLFPRSTFN